MTAGPTFRPLAEPLMLAALEVAELARLGDTLQSVIARLAACCVSPDPELLSEAQAADLLSQRLEGLAAFLRALAKSAPDGVTTDVYTAVMDLTLAEQARRLSGPPALCAARIHTSVGDVTLFGD
jgi:hypothetical protein